MRDRRGVVYAETLVAFLPVFSFFLATLQLADLSVAQLVVQHASTTAVRAAAVVLPDDGSYYGDRDNQVLHQFGGARQADVEQAADLVLRANPRIERAGANVGLDKSQYAERDDLTATVQASYRCLLPLFCGGSVALRSESKLVYQGAKYVYEVTELGDVRPGRPPPSGRPPTPGDPSTNRPPRGDDTPPRTPDDDRPPVADNERPPPNDRPGENGRPSDNGRPTDPTLDRPPAVADNGRPPANERPSNDGRPSDPRDNRPPAVADNGIPPANERPSNDGRPNGPRDTPPPAVADNGRPPANDRPDDRGRPNDPSPGRPPTVADNGTPPANDPVLGGSRPLDPRGPIAAAPKPSDDPRSEDRAQSVSPPSRPPAPSTRPGNTEGALGRQPPDSPRNPVVADATHTNTPPPMGPPRTCEGPYCTRPGQCFAAGTLVHTAAGDRPIESIAPGDRVWSRDEATGALALKPVIRLYITEDAPVLDVQVEGTHGADRITTTPEHPFWVKDRGWVGAASLGDRALLWSPEGSLVGHAGAAWSARAKVYNLEVADYHTYFVGALHAWVHNQCGPVSNRQWNDPNLSVREFTDDYRALNPSSRLTDQQLEDAYNAGERVHPDTGRLRNVSADDAPRIDALHDPRSPFREDVPLGDLPRADRQRLGRILAERTRADRRWQALENDPSASADEVNAARYEVIDASRRAGEAAAEAAAVRIAAQMPGGRLERIYPPPNDPNPGSQSGDFDRVFAVRFDDGRPTQYLVIEAKGGSSGLGTRMVDGDRAQQGTLLYYMSIVNNMASSPPGSPMHAAGRELSTNMGPNVHYLHVQLPIERSPANGGSVPGDMRVREFDIFGPDPFPPRPTGSGT
ncbi:MAG: polymorphic toxin-type HINT domain-containing protein [Polyangiales bacterium]